MNLIYIILSVIVFALSLYLGILINQIRLQKKNNDKMLKEYEESFKKKREDLLQSLYTLALVIEQDQVGIAEGCIRVKKLIDLDDEIRFHEKLTPFHKAYIEFSEFDYLDAYKNLSNQEKFKQDLKRQQVEEKHKETIKIAAKDLRLLVDNILKTGL
jgi:hypothetical protein